MVQCNDVRDPYLPNDSAAQTPTSNPGFYDAQMDYGVQIYGATDPVVNHNYFFGVFNETVSFKEGNRNPTASYNTFEGSRYTGLFFGQNGITHGPYPYSGLPSDVDNGRITAAFNVFREGRDARGVYYMRTPIRVWHVRAAAYVERARRSRSGTRASCSNAPPVPCPASRAAARAATR